MMFFKMICPMYFRTNDKHPVRLTSLSYVEDDGNRAHNPLSQIVQPADPNTHRRVYRNGNSK